MRYALLLFPAVGKKLTTGELCEIMKVQTRYLFSMRVRGDPLNQEIIRRLKEITAEEQAVLDGRSTIDRDLYMLGQDNTINSRKLLEEGKMITLRPHTRFIHFPPHTHDYVEVIYMCQGTTTHIVNGQTILLNAGDLLFLNQSTTHEVCKADHEDLAVNFIVMPEFFNNVLTLMGEEETPLRRFLVDCLCRRPSGAGFLHFKIAEVIPLQNLVENLLFALLQNMPNKRKVSQMTMALLFMQLMGHTEALDMPNGEQATIFRVLSYIETNYISGSLSALAESLHYDLYSLSREIKRKTGKNYTQLVQEKRLAQAAFLLKNTDRNVDDIANAVGYENMGYFHRIFKDCFGVSPKKYRVQIR